MSADQTHFGPAARPPGVSARPGTAADVPGSALSPPSAHLRGGEGVQTPATRAEREPSRVAGQPAQVHPNQRCTCGHGIAAHDIRGNGTRGTCSVTSGLRGVRCGCKSYEAAP